MSYLTKAQIAADGDLARRLHACAASEGILDPSPQQWAQDRIWRFAVEDGWAERYAASAKPDAPGEDEDAITDQMILEAVRKFRAEELAAEPPPPTP